MTHTWTDGLPIYRQLMNEIVGWILSGKLKDGEAIPSIRKIAAQFDVNPLTVSKALQELANDDIVEKQRGVGLFVRQGTRKMLLASQRRKFLDEELPAVIARMKQLDIDPDTLARHLAESR